MDYYKDYYQARQHLNLSNLAFEKIENDKAVFLEKPSRQRIINLILKSYMDYADAAIDNALARYQARLSSQLKSVPNSKAKGEIVSALVESYRADLLDTATHYPSEHSFKIQLDKENYGSVMDWRDDNGYYDNVPGRFLKAVIEEYARKTQYEREGILLRDRIEELQSCINENQLVVVTLNGPSHSRYEVRPYSICCDPGCNYHYLVGLTRKAGAQDSERIASYRISRILSVKRSRSRSGKIPSIQAQEIERKLHDVGVQFLLQDSEVIRVRLTEQGKRMYESQGHLRPVFSEYKQLSDGSWLYTFDCTQMQAEFYFFKFGAEVTVEQPVELRAHFYKKYQRAFKLYESSLECNKEPQTN